MNLEFNFKQNSYFIKSIISNEIRMVEVSKIFIRLYKSGNFDLEWLKSKVIEIEIKVKK